MVSRYPIQIDSLPTVVDNFTPIRAAVVNNIRDAVIAIEAELGIKPSGISGTVRARLDSLDSLDLSGGFSAAGDLSGTNSSQTVIGLQGYPISAFAPTDGYVLTYNSLDGYWYPAPTAPSTSIEVRPSIIFRPGVTTADNHVATWAEVESFITTNLGVCNIYLDDYIAACIVPNTANTEMYGQTAIYSVVPQNPSALEIADGGRIRNLAFLTSATIVAKGTAVKPIIMDIVSGFLVMEKGLVSLAATATVAALDIAQTTTLIMRENSWLNNSFANTIAVADAAAGADLVMYVDNVSATTEPTALPFTTAHFTCAGTPTLTVGHDNSFTWKTQAGWAGTQTVLRTRYAEALEPSRGTTAQRPTVAVTGQMYWDTDLDAPVWWDGAAWVTIAAGGTPGGSDTQIQFNDSSAFGGDAGLTYNKTSNLLSLSDAIALGAIPATTGTIRLANASTIVARDAGNTSDRVIIEVDSSNQMFIGTDPGFTSTQWGSMRLASGTPMTLGIGTAQNLVIATSLLTSLNPLAIGATPATSGAIRLSNLGVIYSHDGAAGKVAIASVDASANLVIGADSAGALNEINNTFIYASNTIYQAIGGTSKFTVNSSLNTSINPLAIGATPATTGNIRLDNNGSIFARDDADTANLPMIAVDTDLLYIGTNSALTVQVDEVDMYSVTNIFLGINQDAKIWINSTNTFTDNPITGGDGSIITSSYSVHGDLGHTFAADADYTVAATQYVNDFNSFDTGSWTVTHTVTYPHPAASSGYYKTIFNNTAYTMTVSTGTGTTRTLATALGQRFFFSSAGVQFSSATFTP